MDYTRLKDALSGQPSYRLAQAEHAVYKELIDNWHKASALPWDLREKLNREVPLEINARTLKMPDAIKILLELADGHTIESVLLKHEQRNTVCVSSQIGCQLDCLFCHTGKLDFKRNLAADEITRQVLFFSRLLSKSAQRVNNVVFMGMGEPFLNFDNTISALKILNSKSKFDISARKISVSTAGIIEKIKQFSETGLQVNLAISLNGPTDYLRSKIMPINKRYPIKALMESVNYYINRTNRKIMFEYVLLDHINDRPKHAHDLGQLLKDILCVVNLIPYNGNKVLKPASAKAANRFKEILIKKNIKVVQRQRFGKEIDAACGQLLYRSRASKNNGQAE